MTCVPVLQKILPVGSVVDGAQSETVSFPVEGYPTSCILYPYPQIFHPV